MKNDEKNILEKEETLNETYDEPSVFVVPGDSPFVVDPKKTKEFLKIEPNHKLSKDMESILNKINIKNESELPEYQMYTIWPNRIATVPNDPKLKKREIEGYKTFIKQMKKMEETKKNLAKKMESEPEGPVLKKVNKPNK